MVDEYIKNNNRIFFAMVLVAIDVMQEMQNVIEITESSGRKFSQRVINNWNKLCKKCIAYGHECKDDAPHRGNPNQ